MTKGAEIAQAAREGVRASWTTRTAGWCSKFIMDVAAHAGVDVSKLRGGTAIETAKNFKAANLSRPFSSVAALKPGDFLFQEHGSWVDTDNDGKLDTEAGHTGIYLGGGMVAENTTYGTPRGGDGRKILPISTFGKIDSVGSVDPYAAYANNPYTSAPSVTGGKGAGGVQPGVIPTAAAAQAAAQGQTPEKVSLIPDPVGGVVNDVKTGLKTYGPDVLAVLGGALLLALGTVATVESK